MDTVKFGNSETDVPRIVQGCMRISQAEDPKAVIETAVANGITFFDHADVYKNGLCEEVFAENLAKTSIRRNDLFIQSKCGIVKGKMYDFSQRHIVEAVEGCLKRLKTDYLDSLLLHRPDTLVEPEEVAAAFDQLFSQGKVRHFGVSNQNPLQIELLKSAVNQPLEANQLQFSLMHTGMIDAGIHVNMEDDKAIVRDDGILEYSRLHHMTIQAWSPYQLGFFGGVFIDNEKYPELNRKLSEKAEKYHSTPTGIASAWILSHPANMQVIIGTMNPDRIEQVAQAAEIRLSKEDWYELYFAAGNDMP